MSSLGLYFGAKLINIVETRGKRIVNNEQIPQSAISKGELEEKVPAEARVIEIIALLKELFRRKNIEAKEATLCLSGKDLIIRNFEIPQLPREELQTAINFEAKKYIPFKVEDLIADFQLKFDKASRTNQVLFMGIKKDSLDRYISILSQLNIKISTIEYAGFSVLRCLKLSGVSDSGIIGILGTDLQGEDEVNFTVLEDGFPLFSRDISLAGKGFEEAGKAETESFSSLEKLKTEIRVSLDYYHRKFPAKNIKNLFFFSEAQSNSELETYIRETGVPAQFVNIAKYIDSSLPYSLSFIKGYSCALYKTIKTDFKLDLIAAKEKARLLKEMPAKIEGHPLLKGLKFDYRALVLGILICAATFGFGIYRMQPAAKQLNVFIAQMHSRITAVNPEATSEELQNKDKEYKRKLEIMDNLVRKQLYLTEPLRIIPRVIPKGMWLTHLSFNRREENKAQLILEGEGYLGDSDKEFAMVNKFVSDLRESPDFIKYFTEINLKSLERGSGGGRVATTHFYIFCSTYSEER